MTIDLPLVSLQPPYSLISSDIQTSRPSRILMPCEGQGSVAWSRLNRTCWPSSTWHTDSYLSLFLEINKKTANFLTCIVHTAFSMPKHVCDDDATILLGFDFNRWIIQPHWQLGPISSRMSLVLILPNDFRPNKYSKMFVMLPLQALVSTFDPWGRGQRGWRREIKKFSHSIYNSIFTIHASINFLIILY